MKIGYGYEARMEVRASVTIFVTDRRHALRNRITLHDTGFVTVTVEIPKGF
jgi:hypothetical protein